MQPDSAIIATTLAKVIALVGGLGCLGWVLLSFPDKLSKATALRFATANLLLVAGLLLVLERGQALTPRVFWLNFWLGDVLLVTGVAFFRDGLGVLLRLPASLHETACIVVAFAIGIAWIPYPNVTIWIRALPFSLALGWLAFRMAQGCLRHDNGQAITMPRKIAAWVFAALGLVMAVRTAVLLAFPEAAVRLESTPLNASVPFLWASTVLVLSINNALAGLVVSGLMQRIHHLANHDPLTGCLNRRALGDCLRRVEARSQRNNRPFGLVMFDIDHFKRINDSFGHQAGDGVLRFVTDTIRQQLRKEDRIARWGGEEFLILLPDTDLATAHAIAQRMQSTLDATCWTWEGKPVHVTASFSAGAGGQGRADLQALDRALYRAKELGRNRVETVSSG